MVIVLVCGVLSSIGLDWGRTGFVSWAPDSIEGIVVVGNMHRLFGTWTHKYPRMQFLINAAFYRPMIKYWEDNPQIIYGPDGRASNAVVLNPKRLDKLAAVSRIISMTMGLGLVVGVYMLTKNFFEDKVAAIFAGLGITVCVIFIYYNHTANVDVPYLFWYVWGWYFFVKCIRQGRWIYFVLMPICFAFSICTKDAAAGYIAAVPIAFVLYHAVDIIKNKQGVREGLKRVFSVKAILAAFILVLIYATFQGIIFSPSGYFERMSFWTRFLGDDPENAKFAGQLNLLWKVCVQFYRGMGWPLLGASLIAVIYGLIRFPLKTVMLMLGLFTFYFVVVMRIRFSVPRFYMPAMIGLLIILGKAFSDLVKVGRFGFWVKFVPIAFVYGLSFLYCVGLVIELANDPRVQAEKWVRENVSSDSSVSALFRNKIYAPRLQFHILNYRPSWSAPSIAAAKGNWSKMPDYIVVSSWYLAGSRKNKDIKGALKNGEIEYSRVGHFTGGDVLWPDKNILGIAGWPVNVPGHICPYVNIYKKDRAID